MKIQIWSSRCHFNGIIKGCRQPDQNVRENVSEIQFIDRVLFSRQIKSQTLRIRRCSCENEKPEGIGFYRFTCTTSKRVGFHDQFMNHAFTPTVRSTLHIAYFTPTWLQFVCQTEYVSTRLDKFRWSRSEMKSLLSSCVKYFSCRLQRKSCESEDDHTLNGKFVMNLSKKGMGLCRSMVLLAGELMPCCPDKRDWFSCGSRTGTFSCPELNQQIGGMKNGHLQPSGGWSPVSQFFGSTNEDKCARCPVRCSITNDTEHNAVYTVHSWYEIIDYPFPMTGYQL